MCVCVCVFVCVPFLSLFQPLSLSLSLIYIYIYMYIYSCVIQCLMYVLCPGEISSLACFQPPVAQCPSQVPDPQTRNQLDMQT